MVSVGSAYFSENELQCSVPQGSCAGLVAYLAYASILQEAIPSDISLHEFADDHLVKKAFSAGWQNNNNKKEAIEDLENVVKNVKTWIDIDRLKMNDGRMEFALFGSRQKLAKCISDGMKVNGTRIGKSEVIKYLGAYLDVTLSMKTHTTNKCRMSMLNLLKIRNFRKILTVDACKTLVQGLVISHLDYCNSILAEQPVSIIEKIQKYKT